MLLVTSVVLSACGGTAGSGSPLDGIFSELYGADCGLSVDLACDAETYCAGLPADDTAGTGTCLEMCGCNSAEDCHNPSNHCYHILCVGYATCEAGHCGWVCGYGPWEPSEGSESPAGQEGDPCKSSESCTDGLRCKAVVDGDGTCQPRSWCKEATVDADCAGLIVNADQGRWTCQTNRCVWVPDEAPGESVGGQVGLRLVSPQISASISTLSFSSSPRAPGSRPALP